MGQAALTAEWPGGRIPEYVRDLTTVAMAVISRDGILIDANRGFVELLPGTMMAIDVLDVRDLFSKPRFDQFATLCADRPGGVIYRGILNILGAEDSVISLQGILYALRDSVLMVAEHEVAGLELLRVKLLNLNDKLAEGQRKLAAAMQESKRQATLARTAIEERDALQARLSKPLS